MSSTSTHDASAVRERWTSLADRLLWTALGHASENGARITMPGAEGGYGRAVDGLEGFMRTFLLAALRIAGDEGRGLDDLADAYRRGVVAGVDPDGADRWVRLDEHAQAKVEAASLALALDMTRPWIWDRLDAVVQQRLIDYLAPVVGDATYPRTNWLWFRVVVQTFLRSVGGPWSAEDLADDLALHDSLQREDGWISDGVERSFDHYVGWALHVYPVLWPRMRGAAELASTRADRDRAALDRYLQDAVALVGGDGSPLVQGRSLIYRFAAAAPFWAGVIAGVPSTSPGLLRHAAESVVAHFETHGAPDADGVLTLGWHGAWPALAQSYSGPGSPYWAVKGLLGVMLPADHPVWAAPAEPLPVESGDSLFAVRAAGWAVSGTRADGIVRIANHGTDHALEGDLVGDSPLYARIGYSTATAPLLDDRAWTEPVEQSVALVDAAGRVTHRAAMRLIETRVDRVEGVAIAASVSRAHLLAPRPSAQRHGSGLAGDVTILGDLVVHSLLRGAWELRVSRVAALEPGVDAALLRLRIGGWPVAAPDVTGVTTADSAEAACTALRSRVSTLEPGARTAVVRRPGSSPLGVDAAVPVVDVPVTVGRPVAVLLELTASGAGGGVAHADVQDAGDRATVRVTWPDGVTTVTTVRSTDTTSAGDAAPGHQEDPMRGPQHS